MINLPRMSCRWCRRQFEQANDARIDIDLLFSTGRSGLGLGSDVVDVGAELGTEV